ncbi:gamma-glutamyl kinase [Gordoniibacillus kamchatkensis]|uniref:Glutamate 5-kinase n=1 Tax=Gordoniibacillus kamchatkensis TaxID=1590651 RepID=A0ABR5AI51_9BACL|nr:glutamate 5-kinase [Paenibacillus sp. VKM B-2647]KIL40047.1 gamma-glutamyl kinase [Paenibacillus sp. VKM B-2647]
MQQRIVVKIGSSSLTSDEGGLTHAKIEFFAAELASLQQRGCQVLLVTSGAVAAGFRRIGYKARPKQLHEKQAAASVGQALLMQAYQEAFARHDLVVAQILLTRSDFSNRKRGHNAMATIEELLKRGVIPIINENDTVSVDELKFSENDTLSALVANLVKAQRLIILTDTDGLYTDDPRHNPEATRIDRVDVITGELLRFAGGSGSAVGTGGMRSKIEAARIAMRGGVPVFVGRAAEPGDLLLATDGSGKGTYFDTTAGGLSMKKQWVGFHSLPQGKIVVDRGAEEALLSGGKSLLPVGIRELEGDFHPGDVVEVVNVDRIPIGRGVVNYASWQLQAVAGLSTDEVQRRIDVPRIEVIHRDEWVAV